MTEILRGVTVYDCSACRGRGRLRGNRGICPDCNGRRVVIIQGGQVIRIQRDEPVKAQTQYLQRLADSQCTACGSPQLESETLCAKCLEKTNERAKNAHRRNRTEEIG